MNALVTDIQHDLGRDQADLPLPEDDVRLTVSGLLATLYPRVDQPERRAEQRFPFPYLVHLTPVGEDDLAPVGETVVVVGKHLSERGLGFYHPKPLSFRRMIVSIETGNGGWIGLLIDLTWCRFTRQGWYESGGRFLRGVPSPMSRRGR
ncbi:MAG: hypothetical protein JW809_17600 [Pirellulales bacterium]|nr:hypothetical protein [Pirellulales bacterium]